MLRKRIREEGYEIQEEGGENEKTKERRIRLSEDGKEGERKKRKFIFMTHHPSLAWIFTYNVLTKSNT